MALSSGSSPDDMGLVQFRIERGAQAEATDGPIGSVEQIVVDRGTGELRALVVRAVDGSSEFELPASSIQRATGDHVYLDISRQELAHNPGLAQPYDPNQYVPVYEGQMEPSASANRIAQETDHPVVTDVEANAAEVVAPATPAEPVAQQAASVAASMTTAEEEHAATPGMLADFTAAPEVVPPDQAAPAPGLAPVPGVTNAPWNPTREHTDEGALNTPLDTSPLTPASGQMGIPEQQALEESRQLYRTGDLYPTEERLSAQAGQETMPQAPETSEVLAPIPTAPPAPSPELTEMHGGPFRRESLLREPPTGMPEEQERMALNLAALAGLIAGGLAAGIGVGVLIALSRRRQRARPSRTIKRAASNATSAVTGAASSAQDTLRQLAANVQPVTSGLAEKAPMATAQAARNVRAAGKGARKALNRRGKRTGWFLRGIGIGATLAFLYAPLPGPIMRARLAHNIERLTGARRSA